MPKLQIKNKPSLNKKKKGPISESERRKNLARQGIRREDDSVYGALMRVGHDEDFEPKRLPAPTAARPGSLEKLLLLADRLVKGEALYHPLDETLLATVEQIVEMRTFAIEEAKRLRTG
jgi:hypothetical protein